MWEAIATTLTSQNAIIVIAAVFLILLLFGFYAKVGLFQVRGKGLRIGGEGKNLERSREILVMKKQVDYVKRFMSSKENDVYKSLLKAKCECDEKTVGYLAKYITSVMALDAMSWVMLNHLSKGQNYIRSKQIELASFVKSRLYGVEYNEQQLTRLIDGYVVELIDHLSLIKTQYEGRK